MSYIFEVNHSGLLNCVVRVRKREESRMASGVCLFLCLFVRTIGWMVGPFIVWTDRFGVESQHLFLLY